MKEKNKISLQEIDRKIPFSVPENYFEEFALQMDAKITTPNFKSVSRIRSWMYAAAVFAGVVIFGSIYYTNLQKENNTYTDNYESYVLSQVDESSMMDYYVNNK